MKGINCRLLSGHYLEYIDNELKEGMREKVEGHLAGCAECRRQVEELRAQAEAADLIVTVSPPEDFSAKVMQRLQAVEVSRPVRRANRSLSLTRAGWTAAAFAVLVLALGYFAIYRAPRATQTAPVTSPPEVAGTAAAPMASLPEKTTAPGTEAAPTEIATAPAETTDSIVGELAGTDIEELELEEALELALYDEEDGYLDDALEGYQAVAEVDVENRDAALFAAGRVYEKMGMTISAFEAFEEALAYSQDYNEWERSEEG